MKGQPHSVRGTSLCAADFLIFFHMKTENRTQATALALLKLRVDYFLA